jgi:MYXO-CTERM domain-containing protein
MIGFGAGVSALALAAKGGANVAPACGAYFDESGMGGSGGAGGNGGGAGGGATSADGSGGGLPFGRDASITNEDDCACRAVGAPTRSGAWALFGLALSLVRRFRRR